jgi:starch synthase
LTQLYGLKYGTLPLVRRTGGWRIRFPTVLWKTWRMVSPVGLFLKTVMPGRCYERFGVLSCYGPALLWRYVQRQAMGMDFSWHVAAQSYRDLYQRLM